MARRKRGIDRALEWFGGVQEMARECRVTPTTVRLWRRQGFASRAAARLISGLTGVSEASLRRPKVVKGRGR